MKSPAIFYHTFENRVRTAKQLISYSISIYESIYKVKNFKLFEGLQLKKEAGEHITEDEYRVFLEEHVSDNVKLIICYENYLKAALILKGYFVHRIGKPHGDLGKDQFEKPIFLTDLTSRNDFEIKNGQVTIVGLRDKTIDFSTIINAEAYRKVLDTFDQMAFMLNEINEERNNLHFLTLVDIDFPIELKRINILNKQLHYMKTEVAKRLNIEGLSVESA